MKTGGATFFLIIAVVLAMLAAGCAETAGDAVCANMPAGDARDHCYQQVAVQSGDVGFCNLIEEAGPASKCYIYLAEKDSNYCSMMEKMPWYGRQGAYDVATCYYHVAQITKFGDYCVKESLINDQGWGNDLAPGGASADRCLASLGCGLQGTSPCRTSIGDYVCARFGDQTLITIYPADSRPSPFECI